MSPVTAKSESPSIVLTGSTESTASTDDALSPNSSTAESASQGTDATPSTTSALNAPLQTSSNSTSSTDEARADVLPLPPKITPALAVAGVLLILGGFTYTLIGIKSKWVQIFLSSAFLTSLSVTVLLIYVMNPPVRPAVQGAYLVAAFMTGIIFGAGSLVFKEVTEGLGCLLGGFCWSMWLLALRAGGTIPSTGGKVILIAVFTATTYALSFSHHTRPYGLIGATSFAGATAAVLGIDCFSKAGLKEFWLYIWNLNDNLFPLNTNTYPITRGIKVELAIIVLICFIGVVSQFKLWKVIKDRRERKDAIRLGDERERDEIEETIGRRFQEGNEKERAHWEAVYGDHDNSKRNTHTDSGLETERNSSVHKAPASVKEVEGDVSPVEAIERTETGSTNNERGNADSAKATITAPGSMEDVAKPSSTMSLGTLHNSAHDDTGAHNGVDTVTNSSATPATGAKIAVEVSHPPHPPVTPLPFTVPSAEKPERLANRSVITFAEAEPGCYNDSPRLSGRGHAVLLPNEEDPSNVFPPKGHFVIPYAAHSNGSSVAATVDDDSDEMDPSGRGLRDQTYNEIKSSPEAHVVPEVFAALGHAPAQEDEGLNSTGTAVPAAESAADESDPEEFQRPVHVPSRPEPTRPPLPSDSDDEGASHSPRRPPNSRIEGSQTEDSIPKSIKRLSQGAVSSTGSLTKGALDRVPSQLSHVVMTYRTNEWAKHISAANEPEYDESEVISGGAEEEPPMHLVERPASVEMEKLQQSETTVLNPPSVTQQQIPEDSSSPATDVDRTFSGKSSTSNAYVPSSYASRDNITQKPPLLATRGIRSSSTPVLGPTLMTSPIDENAAAEFPPPSRPSISPLPLAGSTLLAQRDSLIRNKHSHSSTRNTASPTEMMMYSQPPVRSTSRLSFVEETGTRSVSRLSNIEGGDLNLPVRSASRLSLSSINDEDMPLSQRKAIIQQQPVSLLPESRVGSTTGKFDAHLPQRASSTVTLQKRESMLASWRESLRQESTLGSVPKETVETRRAEMLMEKQQSRANQQHSEVTKIYQENAFDQAMRRGDMQELHKEAMRKMQANANKHVS